MNKQKYPEYITKQDILKFMDISVREFDNSYKACKMISNKIEENFNKKSEVKMIGNSYVVFVDNKNMAFEENDLYVVPNIKDNKIDKNIDSTIIQSKSI